MRQILFIGLGSCLGGILRWAVSQFFSKLSWGAYPWGTFVVNILGCFCIGLFYALFEKYEIGNQELRLFLTVGFCGSFTTFSTFINENVSLLQGNSVALSIAYMTISIIVGMLALLLATFLVRHI